MQNRDRFMLEQKIMECWHVTNDIDTLISYVGDIDTIDTTIDAATQDRLMNILIGMRDMYNLKFSQTTDLFNELVRKGDIAS